ncbi:MAG: hypothetical protein K1060chlam4_00005 [Candidatus Anoxychlamydiales bacterium]|nr:hypothetical protein [Candidatus Anoxychlamydiales bacterium]
MNLNTQVVRIDIEKDQYDPIISGNADELLKRFESYIGDFPKSVEVFGGVLQNQMERHTLLEDWLIIPYYQFFWDSDRNALQWLEKMTDRYLLIRDDEQPLKLNVVDNYQAGEN